MSFSLLWLYLPLCLNYVYYITFCCDCLPLCCDSIYPSAYISDVIFSNPLLWHCLPLFSDFVYPSVVILSTLCCAFVYLSVVILPTPPVLHDFAYLYCQFVPIPPLSLKLLPIHGALVQSKMTASETWHLIGETSNTLSHVQVTHSCQGSGSSLQQK